MLSEILMILVSLTGILFGILLSYIAPEELLSGKKYFKIIKKILFVIISLTALFYFFQDQQYLWLFLMSALSITLFTLIDKIKGPLFQGAPYFLFILPFFLNRNETFHLILASLIFLYGLPTGNLLKMK